MRQGSLKSTWYTQKETLKMIFLSSLGQRHEVKIAYVERKMDEWIDDSWVD